MPVTISQATAADAAAIVALYAPYVQKTSVTFEYDVPTVEDYRRRIEEITEFFPFFLLREDGVPAGYAYAHFFHPRKAYQWMCETSIYIGENFHRKGYASLLYEKLLDALRRQGFCQAVAILGCPNEPSERFHRAMGFELLGTFPTAGYKLGQWHDVKWYRLSLRPIPDQPRDPLPFRALGEL
jgi:L-amino acid N-acyltransferase YncA